MRHRDESNGGAVARTVGALLFLTHSILAAEVKLGPEVPLSSDVELQPVGATAPSVASDGRDFLAVWEDSRMSGPDVYATRVGADGRPADPLGRHIAAGRNPMIAFSASGYLFVWQTPSGIRSLRVDENGAPLSPPRALGPWTDQLALVSNGSTYLLVYVGPGRILAVLLDSEGVVLRKFDNLPIDTFVGGGVRGNRYVLLVRKQPNGPNALEAISDDGSVAEAVMPALASLLGAGIPAVAAFAPNAILLASDTGYMVVGYDGTVIKPLTTVATKVLRRDMAATWDGHQFLLAFSAQDAIRIAADGTLLDAATFPISAQPSHGLTFAFSGTKHLVAWSEEVAFTGGFVARAVDSLDTLATVPAPGIHIAYSGEAQIDAQIARARGGVFAVWSDAGHYEVLASLNGTPMTIDETDKITDGTRFDARLGGQVRRAYWVGWPAVAAGEHVFLVVWRHIVQGEKDRVYARRFDFNGHPLDAAPIVLDASDSALSLPENHTAPAIAFDGSTFLVAWTRLSTGYKSGDLHTIRIGEEGQPFDARETTVAGYPSDVLGPRSVRALWTGAEFLLAYTFERTGHAGGIYFARHMAMVRFSRTNTSISQTPAPPMFNWSNIGSVGIGATFGAGRVALAWVDGSNSISIAQTTLDGETLTSPRVIVPRMWNDPQSIADIIWDGSEYVLVWLDSADADGGSLKLRAMRFDFDLKPIDPAPFDVFSGPGPLSPPWLVGTPTGVLIAYSRFDSANAGSSRAFTRTLDRILPLKVYRRAVGH